MQRRTPSEEPPGEEEFGFKTASEVLSERPPVARCNSPKGIPTRSPEVPQESLVARVRRDSKPILDEPPMELLQSLLRVSHLLERGL